MLTVSVYVSYVHASYSIQQLFVLGDRQMYREFVGRGMAPTFLPKDATLNYSNVTFTIEARTFVLPGINRTSPFINCQPVQNQSVALGGSVEGTTIRQLGAGVFAWP